MSERESLEVDVLVVGGGPAGLAAAYHLRQLKKDLSIAVLEKGKEIGAHIISGAVMDPRGLDELMPDWKEKGGPIENPVEEDHVVFLTENHKFRLPIVPPPLRNHGNYIISLNKFTRWFGDQVEKTARTFLRDSPAQSFSLTVTLSPASVRATKGSTSRGIRGAISNLALRFMQR